MWCVWGVVGKAGMEEEEEEGGWVGGWGGVLGKRGLSTGRAQRIAGARRAPQARGRFSANESGVSERVCVCWGVCVRGSGSEYRAVQGRFHGWLITGVRGPTLATAARPCRLLPPPNNPPTPPPLRPRDKGGPAWPGTARPSAAAPDRPQSLLTMATVWGMHVGGGSVGGHHANGASEREKKKKKTQQPLLSPLASSVRGSYFLWDYFSFFSLICFAHLFHKHYFLSFLASFITGLYPHLHILMAIAARFPAYNTETPWPLQPGKFSGGQTGSKFREDRLASRAAGPTVPDQWHTAQMNDRMMKMGLNGWEHWQMISIINARMNEWERAKNMLTDKFLLISQAAMIPDTITLTGQETLSTDASTHMQMNHLHIFAVNTASALKRNKSSWFD